MAPFHDSRPVARTACEDARQLVLAMKGMGKQWHAKDATARGSQASTDAIESLAIATLSTATHSVSAPEMTCHLKSASSRQRAGHAAAAARHRRARGSTAEQAEDMSWDDAATKPTTASAAQET